MTEVDVYPGVCDLKTTIRAESEDGQTVLKQAAQLPVWPIPGTEMPFASKPWEIQVFALSWSHGFVIGISNFAFMIAWISFTCQLA